MNTIPTIFNEKITPYTVIGGRERIASTGISAVILNRPGYVRRSFFSEMEKTGFDNVISIEAGKSIYNIEELSKRFPFVRYILPEKEINLGEQINLAASEVQNPLFFVLRSDMKIITGGTARRIAERLNIVIDEKNEYKRLCTVPVIMNSNFVTFPSLSAPVTHRKKVQSVFIEPRNDGDLSLYPFNGIGIYDKQRFIDLGGYDVSIKKTYWQLLDFGFRSHLWGEEIALDLSLKLSYDSELPIEEQSIDENYRRFCLKNLTHVLRGDHAHLPVYRFFPFAHNSGEPLFSVWKEFKECRKWINNNKDRFKFDARGVTAKWDT